MNVKIDAVMTKSPHTIGQEQTLESAKRLMLEYGIHHLPVLHGGECVGIISDRDIKLVYAVEADPEKFQVKDACTKDTYSVSPDTPLKEVAAQMVQRGVGSAIVIENQKIIGIFTVTDACRIISEADL